RLVPASKDVVRVTYVLPDGKEFTECWPVLRKYFGEVRPAAMMISASLLDPRMRIEIEVTARKQTREPPGRTSPARTRRSIATSRVFPTRPPQAEAKGHPFSSGRPRCSSRGAAPAPRPRVRS